MAPRGASIVVLRVSCESNPDGTNRQIEGKLILGADAEQIQQQNVPKVPRIVMLTQMSLRPRYSLLSLLVLTALVAGGVKLWYGPHHVVEQLRPEVQIEYSYTRNWDGSRMIHGIHLQRKFVEGKPSSTAIHYYQQGKAKARGCGIEQSVRTYNKSGLQFIFDAFLDCPEQERRAWIQAIDREREKFDSPFHEIYVYNPS